jgi:hypothetical protein
VAEICARDCSLCVNSILRNTHRWLSEGLAPLRCGWSPLELVIQNSIELVHGNHFCSPQSNLFYYMVTNVFMACGGHLGSSSFLNCLQYSPRSEDRHECCKHFTHFFLIQLLDPYKFPLSPKMVCISLTSQ